MSPLCQTTIAAAADRDPPDSGSQQHASHPVTPITTAHRSGSGRLPPGALRLKALGQMLDTAPVSLRTALHDTRQMEMELLCLRAGSGVGVNLEDPNPSGAARKPCSRLLSTSLKARWHMGTQEGRGF